MSESPKIKHFILEPKPKSESKGLGTPRASGKKPTFDEGIFSENVSEFERYARSAQGILPTFWRIKLKDCVMWDSTAQKIFDWLKAEIIKVVFDKEGIIKIDNHNFPEIKRKIESRSGWPVFVKAHVVGIEQHNNESKISKTLSQDWKTTPKQKKRLIVSTFEVLDEEKKATLVGHLYETLHKDKIEFSYNEDFGIFNCELDLEQALQISKNSFVEKLRPPTKIVVSQESSVDYPQS